MKKITLLVALFVCAIGFSQKATSVNSLGENNPVFTQKQNVIVSTITQNRVASDDPISVNELGVNDPVVYQNQSFSFAPCSTTGPGNAFENGKSCTNNLLRVVAHDIDVLADTDMSLSNITANVFIGGSGSGVNASFVDVHIYEDNAGAPGAEIATELGLSPTAQTVVGANFGFDVWELDIDITPVALAGQAGVDTTYWVGLSVEATDASNVFWENSTAGLVGNGEAYDDGLGGGFIIDATLEGVYVITGDCTPIGGTGGPCSATAPGNAFENGKSCTNNLLRVVAHDMDVAADTDMSLTNISANVFIGASGSGVNASFVDVHIYADNAGTPGAEIATELGLSPTAQTVVGANFGFDIWELDIDITPVALAGQAGIATTYWVGLSVEATDASNVFWENSTAGLVGNGEAYDDGLGGGFIIDGTLEGVYTFSGDCTSIGGGVPNDECVDAIDVNCGDTVVGETTTATDSGGNAANDVWYSFTGMGVVQDITLSLCDGGTDYDSLLRVFDACGGTELFTNDDSCGLQSELTFSSDGTSTYYIMVEGFSTNDGNFSLAVTCNPGDPTGPANDECVDAIDVNCGDTIVGETLTATDSGSNAAPDVWYSYTGSGDAEDVTLSLCDGGTDYDSLLRVFDACGGTELFTNDDSCGLQSELTFTSDGTSTYYIMVEGFSTNAGNFSLVVSCLLGTNDNTIAGFDFYPNPATETINLSAQNNIESVTIFNILGQQVVNQTINATSSQLNVSSLVTGTYIMKVSVDGQIGTYKIVKK